MFKYKKYKKNAKLILIKYIGVLPILLITSICFLTNYLKSEDFAYDNSKSINTDKKSIITTINISDYDISSEYKFEQTGLTSWYGKNFHNRKTANGELYDMWELTAAHRKLPFGTIVRIKNLENDSTTLIRINDRGPFRGGKIIDLSYAAAMDIKGQNNPKVKLEALIHNKSKTELAKPYFFAYSFSEPLLCIPNDIVSMIDSTNDFEDIIRMYRGYLSIVPGKKLYIMVSTDSFQDNDNPSDSNEECRKYFIAQIKHYKYEKTISNKEVAKTLK